jgi:hypothetical protein
MSITAEAEKIVNALAGEKIIVDIPARSYGYASLFGVLAPYTPLSCYFSSWICADFRY